VVDTLTIQPLGAGQEVGRSCIILRHKNKTIMLDCGIHPGMKNMDAMPFFDAVDLSEVDLLLVSHFHLDHCGALPYLTEKTTFRGRIYMTHPTKTVMRMLLADYLRVSSVAADEELWSESDLNRCIEKISPVELHQEMEVAGIRFQALNAGHVLGACMFAIEIAGVRVLYTGDYSLEDDRHLMAAEMPTERPDVLIVESTYGSQSHEPLVEREARLITGVTNIVKNGGRCLMPVFALGRVQELLLILEEHWRANPQLHDIPIFYASKLAEKCMSVFKAFPGFMNARIKAAINKGTNPFEFQHITNLKTMDFFDHHGPCVVLAVPGMMQNGVSRDLFEQWCAGRENGVIIAGYCVEGTLAKQLIKEDPKQITCQNGRIRDRRCSVAEISFAAHADCPQTTSFIEELNPPNIVLVHGDRKQMESLAAELKKSFKGTPRAETKIHSPENTEVVRLAFKSERSAKVIGSLAELPQKSRQRLSGVLVTHGFSQHLMAAADVPTYTQLMVSSLEQKQHVPYHQRFEPLMALLEQTFEAVDAVEDPAAGGGEGAGAAGGKGGAVVIVHGAVTLRHQPPDRVVLQWSASASNDMVADAVVAIVMQVEASPASVRRAEMPQHAAGAKAADAAGASEEGGLAAAGEEVKPVVIAAESWAAAAKGVGGAEGGEQLHEGEASNLLLMYWLLREQFGEVELLAQKQKFVLRVGATVAMVDPNTAGIECTPADDKLQSRITESLRRIQRALYPLGE
jgi:cleavage and polyadenylation specificity factor subunit 3